MTPLEQEARRVAESPWVGVEPYTDAVRSWLDRSDHYLDNASPGGFFAVCVRAWRAGLFGAVPDETALLGVCVLGRPVARALPQDGTMAEVTRMYLVPGLPYATASRVLVVAVEECRARGMFDVIAYHDRTRHTGCIYRKAGFVRWGVTKPASGRGWGTRDGRTSAGYAATPKRRWRVVLRERAQEVAHDAA